MKKVVLFLLVIIFGCTESNIKKLYSKWVGKVITIQTECVFSNNSTNRVDHKAASIKIVNYIDSIGCTRCKSQLPLWVNLIEQLRALGVEKVVVLQFIHPKTTFDANYFLSKENYKFPVCVDTNDAFNRINQLPNDERFHCFLLDENNRVILIGNPVQNPKIRDLYIRTICERLGIKPE